MRHLVNFNTIADTVIKSFRLEETLELKLCPATYSAVFISYAKTDKVLLTIDTHIEAYTVQPV